MCAKAHFPSPKKKVFVVVVGEIKLSNEKKKERNTYEFIIINAVVLIALI